jgi:hypothetical protein
VELLFTAQTLLCYATWEGKKKDAEQALSKVYLDMTIQRFSSLIEKFWPVSLDLNLWDWYYYPETA